MTLLTVFIFVAILATAIWVAMRWRRTRRRRQFRRQPFPAEWQFWLAQYVPLYRRLPQQYRDELHGHILVLLDEKKFEGCNGIEVTQEMKLIVLTHAALLLLGGPPRYYPDLVSILIYPDAFFVDVQEPIGDGFSLKTTELRAGESWQHGIVVLSWEDVEESLEFGHEGFNVIVHEFAHQLDQETGDADGMPKLETGHSVQAWAEAFGNAFARLEKQIESGHATVLDDYAAEGPAEFFAVASETFFEAPQVLIGAEPAVYAQLSQFYRLDPASWPRPK